MVGSIWNFLFGELYKNYRFIDLNQKSSSRSEVMDLVNYINKIEIPIPVIAAITVAISTVISTFLACSMNNKFARKIKSEDRKIKKQEDIREKKIQQMETTGKLIGSFYCQFRDYIFRFEEQFWAELISEDPSEHYEKVEKKYQQSVKFVTLIENDKFLIGDSCFLITNDDNFRILIENFFKLSKTVAESDLKLIELYDERIRLTKIHEKADLERQNEAMERIIKHLQEIDKFKSEIRFNMDRIEELYSSIRKNIHDLYKKEYD